MKKYLYCVLIVFVACVTVANAATLTTTAIENETTTFTWVGSGNATNYFLMVGTSSGASDIHSSGTLSGATTSQTVSGLPVDGTVVHVRIWERVGGNWSNEDYSITSGATDAGGESDSEVIALLFYATPEHVQEAFAFGFGLPLLGYITAWGFGVVIRFASRD